MTIGILNYGMGNLSSIKNALDFIEVKNKIVDNYKDIKNFDGLILPGVGAFPEAVKNLKKKNFISELDEFVFNKKKKYFRHMPGYAAYTEHFNRKDIY